MNNEERLKKAFADALELPLEEIHDALAYQECAVWDSIAHMALVASIDQEFDTMMEMDDMHAYVLMLQS